MEGGGEYLFSGGDRYLGQYRQGQRHGFGIYFYSTGALYVGQFRQNRRHGEGLLFYPDGICYAGPFDNGRRAGQDQWLSDQIQFHPAEIPQHKTAMIVKGTPESGTGEYFGQMVQGQRQ
jgi:radial spoke head protein 1